jgi:hypothetical protein
MALADLAGNPWTYFVPLVVAGFLGNPPWSYSTVPTDRIAFSLRSAFEGVSSYSSFCPNLSLAAAVVPVNDTVPDEIELAAFAAEHKVRVGGGWAPAKCR